MNFDFSVVTRNLPFLWLGVRVTVAISMSALAGGMIIGLFIAIVRLSKIKSLERLSGLYIDFFRSTPLLIQLFWIFYALPILTGINLSAFLSAIIGMSLYAGAYMAEIYRAGILSIPTGQREAALSQGMTSAQAMRRIILPQAIRKMLPLFASQFISLFKESSLASIIAVRELIYQSGALAATTLRPLEIFTGAALIYLILTYPQSLFVNYLHKRSLAVE